MKFHKFTSHGTAIKEQVDSKKIRDAPQKEIETLEQESQKGLGEEAVVKYGQAIFKGKLYLGNFVKINGCKQSTS